MLLNWLTQRLQDFRQQVAVVDVQGEHTYADLLEKVQHYQLQLAEMFATGSTAQPVVALVADYDLDSVAMLLALMQHNAVIVPIVVSSDAELYKRLEVVACDWIIRTSPDGIDIQQLKSEPESEKPLLLQQLMTLQQPGLVLFSSGSTGQPKAMVHNLAQLIQVYQSRKPKSLTIMVFLMFDHIGGLNTLLNSLAMGAKMVLPNMRNPKRVAHMIAEHQVQVLPASPTFLNLMLMAKVEQQYDLSSLKMITYGTEPMPESLLKKLRKTFPKTKFLQTFGTSETGIAQTTSRRSDSLEIKISDPNTTYKIVNGELWLKSQTQIMGYLNAPMDSFSADGWFKTGDLVEELDQGYLCIRGRIKEVINVGGEKVLPAEVESVLFELPQVKDCLVYGQTNAITGQMVAAQVVWEPDDDSSARDWRYQLQRYASAKLNRYKVPAKITFVEQITSGTRFKKKRINLDETVLKGIT